MIATSELVKLFGRQRREKKENLKKIMTQFLCGVHPWVESGSVAQKDFS